MEKYRMLIREERCINNDIVINIAAFVKDHTNDYGIKYFLTESGEVSVVNMIDNGTPEVWNDIEKFRKLEQQKHNTYTPIDFNDVIRYFADLSRDGKVWYLEVMHRPKECLKNVSNDHNVIEVLSQREIDSVSQLITYNKWGGLSDGEKEREMAALFRDPVKCSDPITLPFGNAPH